MHILYHHQESTSLRARKDKKKRGTLLINNQCAEHPIVPYHTITHSNKQKSGTKTVHAALRINIDKKAMNPYSLTKQFPVHIPTPSSKLESSSSTLLLLLQVLILFFL